MPGFSSPIYLIGMMGCGKTTTGEQLANLLGWPFTDLDAYLERMAGCTIAELFSREGESGFRKLERQALLDILEAPSPNVVACGGGTPCFFDNLELMKRKGWVIYLETPLALLAERLKKDRRARPLLETPDPEQVLANLLEARKKFYSRAQIIYQQRREGMNVAGELAGHLVNIGGH